MIDEQQDQRKDALTSEQQSLVTTLLGEFDHRPVKLLVKLYPDVYGCARIRMSNEEINQACSYGLIRAAQLFNPARGVKFISYAACWVRSAVQSEINMRVRWMREMQLYETAATDNGLTDPSTVGDVVDLVNEVDSMWKYTRHLSDREKYVIVRRYGIGFGYTMSLKEIARELHITKERVRQIQLQAIDKMRRREGVEVCAA